MTKVNSLTCRLLERLVARAHSCSANPSGAYRRLQSLIDASAVAIDCD